MLNRILKKLDILVTLTILSSLSFRQGENVCMRYSSAKFVCTRETETERQKKYTQSHDREKETPERKKNIYLQSFEFSQAIVLIPFIGFLVAVITTECAHISIPSILSHRKIQGKTNQTTHKLQIEYIHCNKSVYKF